MANGDLRRIEYLIFARLQSLALDVLENAGANEGNQHIPMRRMRQEFEELAGGPLPWVTEGKSDWSEISIAAVPGQEEDYPAQQLKVQYQHGAREELKLPRQRNEPLKVWSDPVRAARPAVDRAYIFLVRDGGGQVHARYIADESALPDELLARIRRIGEPTGAINLKDEGTYILEDETLARILVALRQRKNVILYGPPRTGKTHLMREAERAFLEGISPVSFDPDDLAHPFKTQPEGVVENRSGKSWFLTFHQSTTYESFVAGLMPEIDEKGSLHYRVRTGPLFWASEHALDGGASLLLIDELNRGNTAEIFGELITVIEPDKRLGPDGTEKPFETVKPHLPYHPDSDSSDAIDDQGGFRMAYHVYTLASMNSVDRMVAPLDSALRGRFQIIEVPPDYAFLRKRFSDVLAGIAHEPQQTEWRITFNLAYRLLATINRKISVLRGPDFRLGHAYLIPIFAGGRSVAERRRDLSAVLLEQMVPQLAELFRTDPVALYELLGGEANEGRLFTRHGSEQLSGDGMLDVPGWIELRPIPRENEQLMAEIVASIAGVDPQAPWEEDLPDQEEPPESGAEPEEGEAADDADGDQGKGF
ncbi:AAA family ATPase [Egicoccus sp. AB-alg2]|uniref:AAA family ATPase n=1 Tax=Egicoccus sp. AB-alg2 TaxID=3242693 RepID=UPI00359D73F3